LAPPGSRAASSGDACSRQLPDSQTAPGEILLLESQAAEALLHWRAAYPQVVEANLLGVAGPAQIAGSMRVAGCDVGDAAADLHIRIHPGKQRIEQLQPLCRLMVLVAGSEQLAEALGVDLAQFGFAEFTQAAEGCQGQCRENEQKGGGQTPAAGGGR